MLYLWKQHSWLDLVSSLTPHHTCAQQTIQRSPYFVEILDRYGGEQPILLRVKAVFKEEAARRQAREESGAADPLQSYFVVEDRLTRVTSTGASGVLHFRITVLTEVDQLLAYCQIKEEGSGVGGGGVVSPIAYIRR